MKKLFILILCFSLLALAGCTAKKKKPVPKPPAEFDTVHLTAADKDLTLTVSRDIRTIPGTNTYTKAGNEAVSIPVKIANNSKANIPVSPDSVTLKTNDGIEYKYSASLTEAVTGKSSFKNRSIPPDFQNGGLLIFEIKKGSKAENLTYKDKLGHNLVIKFPTEPKSNI